MTRLFNSFWIAGFESASHINKAGTRLDMIGVTGHDVEVDRDYALLHSVGITTAREGVRWHLVDRPGGFEFSSLAPFVTAARDQRIQVIWNLCHYGWPDGLDVFSPVFIDRFAAYAGAVARFLRENGDETPLFAPVNEISFLAWAAGRNIIFPYAHGRDGEIKRQLVRAAIAGCEAIWDVEPRARIVFADPVYHVVAPHAIPELKPLARAQEDAQYEAWDMLAGNTRPELGGHPRYLDVVGLNFYHANQWEYPDMRLRWEDEPRDPRWIPVHLLFERVYNRYRRPVFIAETSHFGVGRAPWLLEMAREVRQAIDHGVPLEGVCLYPILDRPDWEDPDHWHNSGLWDLVKDGGGRLERILNEPYAKALREAQKSLP
jgi:hypothetical protein